MKVPTSSLLSQIQPNWYETLKGWEILALARECKIEFVCMSLSLNAWDLRALNQHILHTTAIFAVVFFIYPVIYKEFFNSCHLFINGTVNF